MSRRRWRNEPWSRLRRHLTPGLRSDLRLLIEAGKLLEEGYEPTAIRAAMGLSENEARDLASRVSAALRQARLRPDPESRLERALAVLAPASEVEQ